MNDREIETIRKYRRLFLENGMSVNNEGAICLDVNTYPLMRYDDTLGDGEETSIYFSSVVEGDKFLEMIPILAKRFPIAGLGTHAHTHLTVPIRKRNERMWDAEHGQEIIPPFISEIELEEGPHPIYTSVTPLNPEPLVLGAFGKHLYEHQRSKLPKPSTNPDYHTSMETHSYDWQKDARDCVVNVVGRQIMGDRLVSQVFFHCNDWNVETDSFDRSLYEEWTTHLDQCFPTHSPSDTQGYTIGSVSTEILTPKVKRKLMRDFMKTGVGTTYLSHWKRVLNEAEDYIRTIDLSEYEYRAYFNIHERGDYSDPEWIDSSSHSQLLRYPIVLCEATNRDNPLHGWQMKGTGFVIDPDWEDYEPKGSTILGNLYESAGFSNYVSRLPLDYDHYYRSLVEQRYKIADIQSTFMHYRLPVAYVRAGYSYDDKWYQHFLPPFSVEVKVWAKEQPTKQSIEALQYIPALVDEWELYRERVNNLLGILESYDNSMNPHPILVAMERELAVFGNAYMEEEE